MITLGMPISRRLLALLLSLAQPALAEDILDQIKGRLTATDIVQGQFRQEKQLKFLSKPLVSEGDFTYSQGRGVIWNTVKPLVSQLLVSDSRLLTSQGQQTIPPSFGRVFPAMLGGDLAVLRADFAISGTAHTDHWQLQLVPNDPLLAKVIAGITLDGDRELRTVEIRETGGNLSRISFEAIRHPQQLSPEQAADFARLSP